MSDPSTNRAAAPPSGLKALQPTAGPNVWLEDRLDAPSKVGWPIFLHGMWRSGSTYVWSKFREQDATLCYFEPLIESLARLTPRRIRRDTPDSVAANRHPKLAEPYFAEFEPLIRLRGVRDYRRDFATRRFVLGEGDRHPALKRYIAGLVGHAESRGRVAVLGFNRTVLREPWLAANFEAYHLHIDRDPVDVWASYMERLGRGVPTFLVAWLLLAESNQAAPPFSAVAERLPLRPPLLRGVTRPKSYYQKALASLSPDETYRLVFTAWAGAMLQALTYSDLILDMSLAQDADYGADRAEQIGRAVGLGLDFSDLRRVGPATAFKPSDQRRIEREALEQFPRTAFAPYYDPDACRARLHELAPRKAELLSAIL